MSKVPKFLLFKRLGFAITVNLAPTGTVYAEPAALTYSDSWKYDVTGYLFAPASTTGSTTVAGQTVPLDLNLKDALDLLEFAISGKFEAWRGNLGLIVDMNYLALAANAQPIPPISADVNVKQSWLGLLAAYRVASGTSSGGSLYSVDLQAGARYNSLQQTVAISGGPGSGTTLGGTETWWEPVVGIRGLWQINERWGVAVMADAGGFSAGGNDLAWSATLGFDYKTSKNGSMKFGIRHYSIDYATTRSDGPFAYQVKQTGPFIGYTYSFE